MKMTVTLAAASRLTGKDRKTLRRWLENGRLKGMRDADGVWQVDRRSLAKMVPHPLLPENVSLALLRRPNDGVTLIVGPNLNDDLINEVENAVREVLARWEAGGDDDGE
jgi:hypothetical protein